MHSLYFSLAAVSGFLCFGCVAKPHQVHFILPNGYRGAFTIKPNDPFGSEIKKQQDGKYVYNIPGSGRLKIKGFHPFSSYLVSASFQNGDLIELEKAEPANRISIWGLPTDVQYKDTGPQNFFWWFIGTSHDLNQFWKNHGEEFVVGGVRKDK